MVHFFRHELDRFVAEAERAIQLNPNAASVLAYLGESFVLMGDDERGIALVRRAAKLDPYHPTWLYFSIAAYHYQRKEYEQALAGARRINIPGYFWPKLFIAAIYGQLGRQDDGLLASGELQSLYPGFTLQIAREELEKWFHSDEAIEHWTEGLRKAGVPEPARE